jgi:hypothetical protein
MANLGRIGIVAQGEYQAALTYKKLDFVTYQSSSYIAKENILLGEIPGASSKWQLACKKGDTGEKGLDAYGHWLSLGNTGSVEQFVASFNGLKKISTIDADFNSITVAVAQVPNFTLPIQEGKRYKLKGMLHASTVAVATGVRLQLGLVTGGATSFGYIEGQTSHVAATTTNLKVGVITLDTVVANNPQMLTPNVGAIGVPIVIEINVIVNCVANGEIGVWFGSEIANSQATLKAGSFIQVEEF